MSCVFGTARQSFPCTSVSSLAFVWHLVPWHSSLAGVRTWIRDVKCVDRAGGPRRAAGENLARHPGGFVKKGAGAAISSPPLGSAPRVSRATALAALTCCFLCVAFLIMRPAASRLRDPIFLSISCRGLARPPLTGVIRSSRTRVDAPAHGVQCRTSCMLVPRLSKGVGTWALWGPLRG